MTEYLSPTAILYSSLAVLLGGMLLLWAISLRWGLQWSGATNRSWGRIAIATVFANLVAPWLPLYLSAIELTKNPLLNEVIPLVVHVALIWVCLMLVFHLRFGKALKAWLPTLLAGFAGLGIALVYKTYLFESFSVPTNSMAPTILGVHATVACPVCGKPAFATMHPGFAEPQNVICEQFHITKREELLQAQPKVAAQIEEEGLHAHDRILAAKFLQPKRWDLITFQWPPDPNIMYVKRLIGLPGETIVIRDGAVYANDLKLEPPPELQGIKYYIEEMQHFGVNPRLSGSESHPAILGSDEYFVLGDFTAAAADSRYWEKGAPGHPPYAVPADHITGVVTHIFWPWQRMRSFEQH
jgi:signal peptidase I